MGTHLERPWKDLLLAICVTLKILNMAKVSFLICKRRRLNSQDFK